MKYVITKSMKRFERCDIVQKVYSNLLSSGRFDKEGELLLKALKAKKKKLLYGGKKDGNIYSTSVTIYMGLKVYLIMSSSEGIDIIMNTSPIDAGYVEYIRVSPSNLSVIYTQHLLDRYNLRVHFNSFTTHRELMQSFIINNPLKSRMSKDKESGGIIQKIDEGFILGTVYPDKKYVVFNTFYDSEEEKDNDNKGRARGFFKKIKKLTQSQLIELDNLNSLVGNGKLSMDDFEYIAKSKGFV
jgi:hypothetical protein